MVSLCSDHHDASNDLKFDLEVTLRPCDMRSTGDLDLMKSTYKYSDAYQREDLDGAVIFVLYSLVSSKLIGENSLLLKCRYFDFFDPCSVIFTCPKMI